LPRVFVVAITQFLTESTSKDLFHEMIVCCYTVEKEHKGNNFSKYVYSLISETIKKRNRETHHLYNPHRNISLDQYIGNSKHPVSDWLDLSNWDKWE
jgi:ribosomal protein S3AE